MRARWLEVRARSVVAGVLLVGSVSMGGSAAVRDGLQRIPEVRERTLSGTAVDLPAMLTGKVGVLVIGFSRDSREPVAAWGRRLAAEFRGSPTVVYYEMPMLAEVPRMLRGVVVRSIRKEVPERAQPRFVPLTENESRWKDLAGYGEVGAAYVLVVDGTGEVRWRGHGEATDRALAEVREQVHWLARSGLKQP